MNQTWLHKQRSGFLTLFYWSPATDPHRQGKHGEWHLVGFGFSDGQGWHLNHGRSLDGLEDGLNIGWITSPWSHHDFLIRVVNYYNYYNWQIITSIWQIITSISIISDWWIITIQPLELSKIGRQNGLWVVESSSELQLRYSCRSRVWPQSTQSNGWCQNIYELCLSNFYGLARAHTISYPVSCRPPLRNHIFLRGE